MITQITLEEFIFSLNQDEDMRVHIIDFEDGKTLVREEWKSGLKEYTSYNEYKDYAVKDFVLITGGVEIAIVKPIQRYV